MTTTNLPTPEECVAIVERRRTNKMAGGYPESFRLAREPDLDAMKALAVWALDADHCDGDFCPHVGYDNPDCPNTMARAYLAALTDPAVAADQLGDAAVGGPLPAHRDATNSTVTTTAKGAP